MAWSKGKPEAGMLDMKGVLASLANRIVNMIYEVTMSNDNPNIRGWISLIEGFEATMSPYLDEKYTLAKEICLKPLNGKAKEKPSRRQMFKSWLGVYALLCQRMQMYGAYPLTPYEEVQEHDHPEYIFADEEDEELMS